MRGTGEQVPQYRAGALRSSGNVAGWPTQEEAEQDGRAGSQRTQRAKQIAPVLVAHHMGEAAPAQDNRIEGLRMNGQSERTTVVLDGVDKVGEAGLNHRGKGIGGCGGDGATDENRIGLEGDDLVAASEKAGEFPATSGTAEQDASVGWERRRRNDFDFPRKQTENVRVASGKIAAQFGVRLLGNRVIELRVETSDEGFIPKRLEGPVSVPSSAVDPKQNRHPMRKFHAVIDSRASGPRQAAAPGSVG